MKRILSTLTLLLCFVFTAVNAQVITVERAAEIANSFFSAGMQKSAAARGVVASSSLTASFDSNDVTDAASANPTFYVLTNPEGGFVIVSGEETENPIIGYSLDGTIDVNNLPDGFVDYMTDIDAQVRALREYNAANPQKTAAARSAMQRAANFEYNATTMGEIVVDLKTAPWGQHGPFNKLCPVINGVNALTGCVPTAFAILCHYHKWPENGSGTYTNSGQTIDISTSTYDYASMRNDNYPSGQYTEAEANAVALLMRDLGFAYGVLYGTSSTDKSENAKTLKSAFSYKSEYNPSGSGMDAMWRSDVGDEKFIASLKECLDKKRPIPFSSKSTDPETGEGSIRHIFILDGYTKDNYFHFNYGWQGSGNGWYTIDFMQPDEDSDYSTEQRAYLDLIPNRTPRTVTVSANPAVAGTVTVNDNANSAEVTEGTYATLKAIANNGYTFSHWSKGGVQVSTEKTYKAAVAAEGNDYVANFLTVGSTRVNVSVTYNSNYGTVTYNGSAVLGTGITPYQNSEVTLVATPLDGYVFNGWTVTNGTNSTNYAGNELTFVATGDMSVEARFSTAVATYYISDATGTLPNTTGPRYTTWSSNEVSGLNLTASYNSNAVEAISFNNGQVKLVAASSSGNSPVTYTLSAPEGYVITGYSMKYKSSSSNFAMTIANEQMSQTLSSRTEVLTLSATGLSAQNTSFTVSGTNINYAIQVQEFTVTIAKEGANVGGGETPDPTPTPTTYIIYATAGAGGSVTINDDAVSQKSVNEGTTVTLVATPQTGYRFVNWTSGTSTVVSTDATYSFKATGTTSLVANFEETDYIVTVAAGEGGVAYIGTKGTTSTTANYNDNLTITAEANDGYEFVEWRAFDSHFTSNAQQDVTVTADVKYTAVFRSTTQQGGSSSTNLAGKYFRLKDKGTDKYMNIYDNNTHGKESRGGVNVTTKNESNDGQIFQFIESGTNYKLLSKTGYYVTWEEWNVNADSKENGADLTFDPTAKELEYFISCTKGYFKIDDDKGEPSLGKFVYCDGDYNAAATWVLEEVVYYTVTATAGNGGSVSPETSTVKQGNAVTLVATPSVGYRFVNWTTKDGAEVSTSATYTVSATANATYTANFEKITYTITATAGNGGSVSPTTSTVEHGASVTLVATPSVGYRFVNWTTKDGAEVSTSATYTVSATADATYTANFEPIVVNVVLTEIIGTNAGQTNEYRIQLQGFTNGITKETVAAKLDETYPYITLGEKREDEIVDNGKLQINGDTYTYTNNVILPFKVSNAQNEMLHNIYYPSNNTSNSGYPNYLAALNEDEIVDMAASPNHAYGDNPDYNTLNGDKMISWAIYSVNNGFEFIFKNNYIGNGKYIKVESVVNATGNTQNVKFVDNVNDATAFTLLKDNGTYNGDYALVANVGETTGYLCASSSDLNHVTHFDRNNHQGAWAKFVESPDYNSKIMDMGFMLGTKFCAGDAKCIVTPSIQEVIDAMQNYGTITWNTLTEYGSRIEDAMNNWPAIKLTIDPEDSGTTNINGEENVVHKYVPNGYELPLAAVPAVGYHFVSWTDGTSEVETAEYTKTISGTKGDVIALTANFAKDTYTINVSTNGTGGSATASAATVEHGNEVTLTAVANEGYDFVGWYNGDVLVSNEANYTFTATSDINYTARFNEVAETPTTVAIEIVTVDTDGNTLANNDVVKAIIGNVGDNTCTAYDFVKNADVKLVATNDYNLQAYLFDGWYKNGNLVDNELEITVQATEAATYKARFFRGCVVTGMSNNNRFGYISSITLADGTSIGYDASNRAVVREGTTVKLNPRIENGYTVGNWTDVNSIVVSEDESLIIEVNEDVTYTANFEPVSYKLTVSANDDSYGTVNAVSDIESGKTIRVGNAMEATITATANTGYRFVNWTKGTDVVSYDAEYTVPAIADVSETEDTEYVAVFEEIGTYYRIAYNFEVPVETPAKSAATRAATTYTYAVNYGTGTSNNINNSKAQEWVYKNSTNEPTLTLSATVNGSSAYAINMGANATANPKLYTHDGDTKTTPVKYTLSVSEGYIITNYKFEYFVYYANYGFTLNGASPATKTWLEFSSGDVNAQTAEFTISSTNMNSYMIVRNFTVTIQPVGGETPEPETETVKYYVQSEACGVSGKENALKMTTVNDNASSIFYCVGNKLMSYAKGTYVNENGNTTRGLQGIGVEGGEVTFESNKIKFTNGTNVACMHAKESNGIYYVDNCGATATCGNDDHNFIFEVVESLPVTISAAGYASWYAPVAVIVPDGLEAWYFDGKIGYKGEDKYAIMAPIGGDVVPANTGVILTGKDGKPAENGTYYLAITDEVDPISGNKLEGTVAATYITEKSYVLATGSKGIGLYEAMTEGQAEGTFLNNSHKAYLPASEVPAGAALSAGFRFSFGGTTAIEKVESRNEKEEIYDLTGRKLEGISGTGIYIINGKKILVK